MLSVDRSRRSRLFRQSTGKRICLSPRDIDIFRLLDRYRYLRSSFICAFFPDADQTGLVKQLGDLFHEGYLDRPARQYQYANALYLPAVYELNQRSEAALREQGGGELPAVLQRGRMGAHRHFSHALMIADILASVELGLRRSSHRVISWKEIIDKAPCKHFENPFRIPVSICHGSMQRVEITMVPDGLFGIEYRKHGERSYRFFALEADRNSMPVKRSSLRQTSYLRKLLGYREILARGIHQSHFGMPNLLILNVNVTTSETHKQNIIAVLSELTNGKGSMSFLFKTMTALGDGMKAPLPSPHMYSEPWERQGHPPFKISEA